MEGLSMKKILVVDDSKTIRTLCEWIYKGLEDKLFTADSAESARLMMSKESPDVVIVDYTLPDTDSYDFVSSICENFHVIMMGGTYAPFDEAKAKASGAAVVITKPFKTADFFKAVEEAAEAPMGSNSVAAEAVPAPAADVSTPTHAPAAESVQPIANFAASVPPISSHSMGGMTSGSGLHTLSTSMNAGVSPAPRRFNFPSGAHTEQTAESQRNTPSAPVSGDMPAFSHSVEHETPKTPVPSVSPAVLAANQEAAAAAAEREEAAHANEVKPEIDPAVLRAEVVAAVKSMLPAIVNSYLKKLIQAEVKPQLQNWVDTRVEALVNKILQDK